MEYLIVNEKHIFDIYIYIFIYIFKIVTYLILMSICDKIILVNWSNHLSYFQFWSAITMFWNNNKLLLLLDKKSYPLPVKGRHFLHNVMHNQGSNALGFGPLGSQDQLHTLLRRMSLLHHWWFLVVVLNWISIPLMSMYAYSRWLRMSTTLSTAWFSCILEWYMIC